MTSNQACDRIDHVLGERAIAPATGGIGFQGEAGSTSSIGGTGGTTGGSGLGASAGAEVGGLSSTIDISLGGPGTRILLGDVVGDGRLDIVTMQPDSGFDDREVPHQIAALTAFDLLGNFLWQVGTVDPASVDAPSDLPAQIYDIDQDGENEVLAVMGGEFRIFDGKTGELEESRPLPDPEAHGSITIANLTGDDYPNDIVLKNRYTALWAFDEQWNQLFTFAGALSCFPWPYDWDGDGQDELMAGCDYLESDGSPQWSCNDAIDGDPDCVFVGDVDGADGEVEILVGGGNTMLYDRFGNQRWSYDTVEAQNAVLGDFRPDLAGLEIAGVDRIFRGSAGQDAVFLLSAQGEALWYAARPPGSGWRTIVTTMNNWDGSHSDLVAIYRRGEGFVPTLFDGYFDVVAEFSGESAHLRHADLCGDEREEVLILDGTTVSLFSNGPCDLIAAATGVPRPQIKRLYNWTRCLSGEARALW